MNHILVLLDHFSKWLGAYALANKTAASVAIAFFQRSVWWPLQLHSDQGAEKQTILEKITSLRWPSCRGLQLEATTPGSMKFVSEP